MKSLELPIDRAAELPSEGLPLNSLWNDPVIDSLSKTHSSLVISEPLWQKVSNPLIL